MTTANAKEKSSRLGPRRTILLYTLLAVCVIWFPLSLVLNPGWGTLGLMANPSMLLAALIPVAVVLLANALQPKAKLIPNTLFRMEVVFCALWILLWSFMVNGGDTNESMHSIFSRLFSIVWNEKALVGLSGRLFGCTIFALTVLAFLMAIYRQADKGARRAVWGRRLLAANFAYLLVSYSTEPILASFRIYINPYWTWFYIGLDVAVCLLSVLNVIYLVRYFSTHNSVRPKIWVAGAAGILVSLYALWGAINMFLFFLRLGHV